MNSKGRTAQPCNLHAEGQEAVFTAFPSPSPVLGCLIHVRVPPISRVGMLDPRPGSGERHAFGSFILARLYSYGFALVSFSFFFLVHVSVHLISVYYSVQML